MTTFTEQRDILIDKFNNQYDQGLLTDQELERKQDWVWSGFFDYLIKSRVIHTNK